MGGGGGGIVGVGADACLDDVDSQPATSASAASSGTASSGVRRMGVGSQWCGARRVRGDGHDAGGEAALGAVLHLPGQLSARGVDVVAARLADRGDAARVLQRLLEPQDALARRHGELGARERVERDQVELARHVARQRDELGRVPRLVVHAVEHHVLERHEVARRALEIAQARGHQVGERVLAVDRHQPVAQRVVGRVQRHGERDRARVAQAVDQRHEAGRRQRDAPARQSVRVVVEHELAAPARRCRNWRAARPCPSSRRS